MSTPGSALLTRVRTLRLSIAEGMLYAVMLGASESYLGTLAVELGHRDQALALLATVPLLAGAIAQLSSGWLTRLAGTRRRLVTAGAFVQAGTILGFQAVAGLHESSLMPLMAIKVVFWMAGSVIGPPWGAWMADLTVPAGRSRFFAWRSAFASLALVTSFALSGHWLHRGRGAMLDTYVELFWIAFLARTGSALLLAFHYEPPAEVAKLARPVRLRAVWRRSRWRTALYMSGLMFAAHVSTPFFTPYMLRTLRLDYAQFAVLMSASIVAKAVVFPLCHPVAQRFGMPRLLWLAGLGVACTPALWYLAPGPAELLWVELFAGTVWAAWEYVTFQLLLAAAPARHRLRFLSIAGTITAMAQVLGALVGTALIERFAFGYPAVFLVSSGLRFVSLLLLVTNLKALWSAGMGFRFRRVSVRAMSVRPNAGAVGRLVDPGDEPD